MKRILYLLLIVLSAGAFTSCRHNIVYSEFISIPSGEWYSDMLPQFDYTITDKDADYRMLIYVRHTEQ